MNRLYGLFRGNDPEDFPPEPSFAILAVTGDCPICKSRDGELCIDVSGNHAQQRLKNLFAHQARIDQANRPCPACGQLQFKCACNAKKEPSLTPQKFE